MRWLIGVIVALVFVPVASAQFAPSQPLANTEARLILYIAHDGIRRTAWLLLPIGTHGPIPLIISPHGRGVGADENALIWGDLPGEGGFAVINPAGEGRRLHWFSWGAAGQISDLARMPAVARAHGVDVDRHRIYAFGGSMGGQETLLLVARHPRLLAGAAAFDPATDLRRRYYDFAALKGGRTLQRLAREEVGGTPDQVPQAYALRSPDHYIQRIASAGVPLQIFWSTRDRVITDQYSEAGALSTELQRANPRLKLWEFEGEWAHTAEMRSRRRLPRALARFGLLPWPDVPRTPAITRARSQPV
jgi:dipeptidyl aminopeptidase/acylaminoacyl peptidase